MGAGISAEIQKNLLEAWEPRRATPPALEREVREFLQRAQPLLEVQYAPHAPDAEGRPASSSAHRPEWLEPSQLHIALVGQEVLVDAFLESLKEVAPLLEVVPEEGGTAPEEEDGSAGVRPLEMAAQAGYRCHAFIDEDLHLLRFWALQEGPGLTGGEPAGAGFPYLDLVVLLVRGGAAQADGPGKLKVGAAELAAKKQAERRAGLEAELAALRARLRALPVPAGATDGASAEERLAVEEELRGVLSELDKIEGGSAVQRDTLEAELKAVRAKKQALIEEEEFEGAHAAKLAEKGLLAKLDGLKRTQEQRHALEEKRRQLESRLLALGAPQGSGGADRRRALEEELGRAEAQKRALVEAEDYDSALKVLQQQKALLSELDALEQPEGDGAGERGAVERELRQVRAKKQALIEAEDYDRAYEAKQQEQKLLARRAALTRPQGGGAHQSALERELQQVRARKRELIEAEDYDGAHEAKQREKELVAKLEKTSAQGGGDRERSLVEEELQRVRAKKQELIEAEDYDGAHEAKQKEKELLAKLESLKSAQGSTDEGLASSLTLELQQLQTKKQALIDAEDYDAAHEVKQREKELLAKLESLRGPSDGSGERSALEKELKQVRAEKQALIEVEDYDGAHEAKQKEKELLDRLEGLKARKASGGTAQHPADDAAGEERHTLEEEINRVLGCLESLDKAKENSEEKARELRAELEEVRGEKRSLIEAEDFDGAHEAKQREKALLAALEGLGAGASKAQEAEPLPKDAGAAVPWSAQVDALAGGDKPPVLIASCGPAPPGLREAAGVKLRASELFELGSSVESFTRATRFWDALSAGLRMVQTNRAFPRYVEMDLGGGYSLGDWVFIQDEEHPFDGHTGVATGFEDDGTWDFKITVRLTGGEVLSVPQDKLNPLATAVEFDVSTLVQLKRMDMMWVRLKGLKGRADLNDCEGYATAYSVTRKEEGHASIYDSPARHTVTLEDGNEVRVKAENFDILEKPRGFLQDLPGLVDALHLDGERYSVLVVRHGEQGPATIQGLRGQPAQRGAVIGFNEATQQYIVVTDTGNSEISVKKDNLVFDVPKTVAQRLFLRPLSVEELQGDSAHPE